MSIVHLTSVSQLNSILSTSKDKLSVIDFHATWCGPCHTIAPHFETLAKQYPGVNFLKCDVDAARDVASLYSVSAMPTFIFLKGSTKVDQVRGADRNGLSAAVKKHSSSSSSSPSGAFSGKGQTLSGSSPSAPSGDSGLTNISPQARVFLLLVGAYLVLWYFT